MSAVRTYENSERPDGWREVRLGDVVEINQRNWDPRDGAPILYLDLTAVIAPGRLDEPKELAASDAPSRARRRVLSGDILVSTVRPNLRGFARVQKAAENLVASTGFAVLTPSTEVEGSFVYHHVMTEQFAAKLEAAATGQAYPAVRPDDVSNYSIALPPQSEQRAIADVLDSIDVAIERTEAIIAATETLRDSLLHELLTRGVPGWHTEWKDVPGIGTIPADWEVVRLGDGVVHVGSGVTPRGGKSVYTPSGITFLRSQNVHFDGLRLENVVRIPPETDKAMARSRVQPNDVLLNITGASIGRCTVVPSDFGPANVNQHVCIIRTSDQFNPRYVWKWLSTPRSQKEIDDIQTGQSRQGLNYQQVRQLSIALPPRSEQDAFVEILSGLDATIAEAKREQDGLRSLKESTADALLTGEARINN